MAAKARNLNEHLVVAYQKGHSLVPVVKLPNCRLEFVEHTNTPPAPAISFSSGESDIYLSDNFQHAYQVNTVPIATYNNGKLFLLVAPEKLSEIRNSRMVHAFLLALSKTNPDLMLYPRFVLKFSTIEEFKKTGNDPYDVKDVDY